MGSKINLNLHLTNFKTLISDASQAPQAHQTTKNRSQHGKRAIASLIVKAQLANQEGRALEPEVQQPGGNAGRVDEEVHQAGEGF